MVASPCANPTLRWEIHIIRIFLVIRLHFNGFLTMIRQFPITCRVKIGLPQCFFNDLPPLSMDFPHFSTTLKVKRGWPLAHRASRGMVFKMLTNSAAWANVMKTRPTEVWHCNSPGRKRRVNGHMHDCFHYPDVSISISINIYIYKYISYLYM